MVNLKKITKILTGLALIAGLGYTGIDTLRRQSEKISTQIRLELALEKQSLEYPEENETVINEFRKIAKKQDSVLGLQNFEDPEILFDEVFKYGLDPSDPKATIPQYGWYDRSNDIIWINLKAKKRLAENLSHERGHWYPDKLSESIGNGSWRLEIKSFIQEMFQNAKGDKLISEGIAAYFERKPFGGPIEQLSYKDFEKYFKRDSTDIRINYDVGYALVAPILDRSVSLTGSVDKGIELLIKNTPEKRDLKDLVVYRERILDMVDKK